MSSGAPLETGPASTAPPTPAVARGSSPGETVAKGTRDGRTWQLGTGSDVAWIDAGTSAGLEISSALPEVFDAYATVVLPEHRTLMPAHDAALLSVLSAHTTDQRWWLGYLDTGVDDIVFPDARRVTVYDWSYVLVLAGAEQAATWRRPELGSLWSGRLPDLAFPRDRSWLLSTLWDDDWTCVSGTVALIDDLLSHVELRSRARRVKPGQDATPPGHTAR